MPTLDVHPTARLDEELAGLDALETAPRQPRAAAATARGRRPGPSSWPSASALLALADRRVVGLEAGVRARRARSRCSGRWASMIADGTHRRGAAAITMQRAVIGFAVALVIGVHRGHRSWPGSAILRAAFGSLITGLQTMPSIAWFPLAILLFQLSEQAILFVVVLGAAPAIANGLIAGVDHIPPILAAGRAGARGPRPARCTATSMLPAVAARRSSAGSSRAGRSPGAA